MKRSRPEGEPFGNGTPPPAVPFSKDEVQNMISQEVRLAVQETDQMMKTLMERVQEIDSEPKYDARIKKLRAHVKKIKRRGDAVFVHIRKHGTSELLQNQQSSLESLQTLTDPAEKKSISSSADGGCSSDGTSTSAGVDCGAVRKPKEGFWQHLRSKKQIVDLTDEDEVCRQNGKPQSSSPPVDQVSVKKEEDTETPLLEPESRCPVGEENKMSVEEETQASLRFRLPPFPDAPFPDQLPVAAATKNMPQKPVVKVAHINNPQSIALLWNVEEQDPHAPDMECYYIYVSQEYSDGTFSNWKTMGVIKALPLPMACRLVDQSGGKMLCFVIVGKDIYGRYGPYSDVKTVLVNKT